MPITDRLHSQTGRDHPPHARLSTNATNKPLIACVFGSALTLDDVSRLSNITSNHILCPKLVDGRCWNENLGYQGRIAGRAAGELGEID
jgi:hypothetical protein